MTQPSADYDSILQHQNKAWTRAGVIALAIACVIIVSSYHSGLLDLERLGSGFPALWQLGTEMFPGFQPRLGVDQPSHRHSGDEYSWDCDRGTDITSSWLFRLRENSTQRCHLYDLAWIVEWSTVDPGADYGHRLRGGSGIWALPGVLALGLHSVGMVGKFFAEAIEHCDNAPIEAARAAGASPFQIVTRAILPQVLPQLADVTIYRWEYNFRASTILGTVGAGGIGFELMTSLRIMNYQEVLAIMLVVLLMVTIVDQVGALLRRQLQ